MVRETDVFPDTREDVLRKLDHAIDLTRIIGNDSMREGRQMTTVGGHLRNLGDLLIELRKDIKKDGI